MLCVVSGQHRYSRKIFSGKTFTVSKTSWKPQKFSPSNDLTYTVCTIYTEISAVCKFRSLFQDSKNLLVCDNYWKYCSFYWAHFFLRMTTVPFTLNSCNMVITYIIISGTLLSARLCFANMKIGIHKIPTWLLCGRIASLLATFPVQFMHLHVWVHIVFKAWWYAARQTKSVIPARLKIMCQVFGGTRKNLECAIHENSECVVSENITAKIVLAYCTTKI